MTNDEWGGRQIPDVREFGRETNCDKLFFKGDAGIGICGRMEAVLLQKGKLNNQVTKAQRGKRLNREICEPREIKLQNGSN
jgi:hypothetical protein